MHSGPLLSNNKANSIILCIHLLLHHVISVHDPHLALTYISWSSDLPCISDPIIKEDIILWILVRSVTVNDLILFVGNCDPYLMAQQFFQISLALSNR